MLIVLLALLAGGGYAGWRWWSQRAEKADEEAREVRGRLRDQVTGKREQTAKWSVVEQRGGKHLTTTIRFGAMQMMLETRSIQRGDWTSDFDVRRLGPAQWQIQETEASREAAIARLEEEGRQNEDLRAINVDEIAELRQAPEWTPIERNVQAIEDAYQQYIASWRAPPMTEKDVA